MQKQLKKTITVYGGIALLLAVISSVWLPVISTKSSAFVYLLPIIVILAVIGIAFDSFGMMCILLAWIPFSEKYLRFEAGIITLSAYTTGMVALAIWLAIRVSLGISRYQIKIIDLVIAVLCFSYLCSTLLADDIVQSGYLAFHALFVPVVSYFVLKTIIRTDSQYRMAIASFVSGIVVMGIFGIIQFVKVQTRLEVLQLPYIGIATLAVAAFVLTAYSKWNSKLVVLPTVVITLLTLGLTFSRAYLLYALLSPILLLLVRRGQAFFILVIFLCVTLFSTLYVSYNAKLFKPAHAEQKLARTAERITAAGSWKTAVYWRALTYRDGLKKFEAHPMFGVGIVKGKVVITQHNFHVEWLEYGGIVGYLLYASVFLNHFWRARRRSKTDPRLAATLSAILIILGNSFTNGIMHGLMPYVIFLLLGFGEALLARQGKRPAKTPKFSLIDC